MILPEKGIISIKELAELLEIKPAQLQEGLQKNNIPYISLMTKYNAKLVRLEDIKKIIQ